MSTSLQKLGTLHKWVAMFHRQHASTTTYYASPSIQHMFGPSKRAENAFSSELLRYRSSLLVMCKTLIHADNNVYSTSNLKQDLHGQRLSHGGTMP